MLFIFADTIADDALIAEIKNWEQQNQAPSPLFVIASDEDYANVLYKLRKDGYSILLACKIESKDTPIHFKCIANFIWDWRKLFLANKFVGLPQVNFTL